MKKYILLFIILSVALISCGAPEAPEPTGEVEEQAEITQDEALDEVDDSLLSEDDDVEIGEMI